MRRFFREVLSLCLALAMLTVGCMAGLCEETTASEEDDVISFEPTLANALDYSAQEWFSCSFNRALLTILLAADLGGSVEENTVSIDLVDTSFVAKDSVKLIVYFHGEQSDLIIFYTPVIGEAAYSFMDKSSDAVIQNAFEATVDGGCYKNDLEDILEIYKELTEDS